jgi:hypothetical protein
MVPALAHLLPPEYHQWITSIVGYACKAFGVSLAWCAGGDTVVRGAPLRAPTSVGPYPYR